VHGPLFNVQSCPATNVVGRLCLSFASQVPEEDGHWVPQQALGDNDDDAEWKTSRPFRRDGQPRAARQKSFHERHTKIKYPN